MTDSRAIDQESRRLIREELLTNILVEAGAGSGKTQMLAERMAAGVAAGVYSVEHMAAVTFTRKAASELRGRFHLALEGELSKAASCLSSGPCSERNGSPASSRRSRISSASSPGRFIRSARVCCASGRLSPACLQASPSSTRFRILSCASECGGISSRVLALPATRTCWRCWTPISARRIWIRRSRRSASTTMSSFRPVKPIVPIQNRRGRRSRSSGQNCRNTCLRQSIQPTQPAGFRSGATVSGAVARLAISARPSFRHRVAAGHVGLRIEDRSEVVGGFAGREEALA